MELRHQIKKVMAFGIFWDSEGILLIEFKNTNITINGIF